MASLPKALGAISSPMLVTGCSVGMGLSGLKNPGMGAIRIVSTRAEAEMYFGSSVYTNAGVGGTQVDVYVFG